MTCIIALKNKSNTYMACDSAIVGDYKLITKDSKIIYKNDCLIGMAGRLRLINLIQIMHGPYFRKEFGTPFESIVSEYIPRLRKEMSKWDSQYSIENKKDISFDGEIIIAHKNEIYLISEDFSVSTLTDSYFAIGSGSSFAMGSMFEYRVLPNEELLEKWEEKLLEMILKGMRVAARFEQSVGFPVRIYSLKGGMIGEFDEKFEPTF